MNTESSSTNSSRKALRELTESVRPLVDAGQFATINEALIAHYQTEEHQVFHTFKGWKEEGMAVRKGEKAFLIWAKPRKAVDRNEDNQKDQEYTFFPVSHIFSNAQVIPLELEKEPNSKEEVEFTQEYNQKAERLGELETWISNVHSEIHKIEKAIEETKIEGIDSETGQLTKVAQNNIRQYQGSIALLRERLQEFEPEYAQLHEVLSPDAKRALDSIKNARAKLQHRENNLER